MVMNKKTMEVAGKLGKHVERKGSVWVDIPSSRIARALKQVRQATERISDLCVYDTGKGMLEVMYRFVLGNRDILTIRTKIRSNNPKLPTCTGLFPGALLFEREQHEMFGVQFSGHPGLDKCLYADSTPKTPLRKDSGWKAGGGGSR